MSVSLPIRLADHDWMSATTDTPASVRFEGRIDTSGVTTIAQLGFWPWGSGVMQAGAAQVRLLDADGLLDAATLADLSGVPVALEQVGLDGSLAEAVPVARYVVDRLIGDRAGRKTLVLLDAHDALDRIINDNTFSGGVSGLAGQRMPMSIGRVFNAPVVLTGSDGSVGWIADAPQSILLLRDRADPMEPGTWALDPFSQQILFQSPPLGPVTSDLASVSGDSLEQCLREVMRRAGMTAWSSSDAAAIDTATGYGGIGYFATQPVTARAAMTAMLSTFGAWPWQDATGVLRLVRIVDPDTLPVALELNGAELVDDVVPTVDTAPGLSVRMAYQLNARVMRETDFVSDLVDVPPELRAQLSSPQGGIVSAASAATLPSEYRHALDADPYPSLFWAQADAQAEIDRVVALYQKVRRNWEVSVRGLPALAAVAALPGTAVHLTSPQYGLSNGRKLLVRRVERNPVSGDIKLTLWG